jgi:hypothetical protein
MPRIVLAWKNRREHDRRDASHRKKILARSKYVTKEAYMDDETDEKPDECLVETEPNHDRLVLCTCAQDPFTDVPPELRPRAVKRDFGLRKVKCPHCGFVYWTTRKTDLCVSCEKMGVKLPEPDPDKEKKPGG